MEVLFQRGQVPDEFLYHMETARNRLHEMEEQITDGYFTAKPKHTHPSLLYMIFHSIQIQAALTSSCRHRSFLGDSEPLHRGGGDGAGDGSFSSERTQSGEKKERS